MVSRRKALTSLFVSLSVVLFRTFIYKNLQDLLYISPIIVTYCIGDIYNKPDMVVHHVATVFLNIMFLFVVANQERIDPEVKNNVGNIVTAFFDVETSTVALSLMHLGYRSVYVKLVFFALFVYYRVFLLNLVIYRHYKYQYLVDICGNHQLCYASWYTGSIPLVVLNIYWFLKLVGMIINNNKKKNK
jgi:hypothetical protein